MYLDHLGLHKWHRFPINEIQRETKNFPICPKEINIGSDYLYSNPGGPVSQCCDLHSGKILLDILLYLKKKGQVFPIEIFWISILENNSAEFLDNRLSCWRFAYDIPPQWKYVDTFYCTSQLLCLAHIYFSNIASVKKSFLIIICKIDHTPALSL